MIRFPRLPVLAGLLVAASIFIGPLSAFAEESQGGGEASLVLPDLARVSFLGPRRGARCWRAASSSACSGLLFGLVIYRQLKNMPVHKSMLEISELIYETCKTYLITQVKFILHPRGASSARSSSSTSASLQHTSSAGEGRHHPRSSASIGIAGCYGVAWFGIRVNTFANSRTAFAALKGKPFPDLRDPAQGRHEHRHAAHLDRAAPDARASCSSCPRDYAGPCFIGFAIGESLGASALRIAGGIFTKIADIGSDLMKIVFNIKEDDARNPGVIADCTGDNAGDSVGPSADGFETYGVTGVALITFILLAVTNPTIAGPAPRLDLRDAHRDGHRQRASPTSSTRRSRRHATATPTR